MDRDLVPNKKWNQEEAQHTNRLDERAYVMLRAPLVAKRNSTLGGLLTGGSVGRTTTVRVYAREPLWQDRREEDVSRLIVHVPSTV